MFTHSVYGLPGRLSSKVSYPGGGMATHSIFLPGKPHGQRSLAGYSPQDYRVRQDLAGEQFCSVAQLCPTLCDPMDCSTPGLPVHHFQWAVNDNNIHVVWSRTIFWRIILFWETSNIYVAQTIRESICIKFTKKFFFTQNFVTCHFLKILHL